VKTKKRIIRRSKKNTTKLYFTADTQKAIEKFQLEDSTAVKEKIYVAEILPAFDKLAENLIFIYDFKSHHSSYENLKHDCVAFLYETLYKFDPTRGTKAFSYFNVVAKNWLIIVSKKNATSLRRNVSLDDVQGLGPRELEIVETHQSAPPPDQRLIDIVDRANLTALLKEIQRRVKNENEKLCIDSIIRLFDNAENLDFLNKRAVFLYIREMSGLSPKKLTVAMSSIKKLYRELKKKNDFELF